jgi:hypothetical protein
MVEDTITCSLGPPIAHVPLSGVCIRALYTPR